MDFKCGKCGNVEQVPDQEISTRLMVSALDGWEQHLAPATVTRLKAKEFKKVVGESDSKDVMTLFLTTIHRQKLLDPDRTHLDTFVERIVPVLKKVDENFKILGALSLPSTLKLAQVDLSVPHAIFAFVTIENHWGVLMQLRALGLMDLLVEGAVDTILGDSWFGDRGRP